MKKPVTGTGSTLVVLVFTVLCLTIFMLISLSSARIDKKLADAEELMVKSYYEADLQAEYIIDEILGTAVIPASIRGIDISSDGGEASFSFPISDSKELYVKISIREDSYEILEWRTRDTDEWEIDSNLPVWSGD